MREHRIEFDDIASGPFPDYSTGPDAPVVGTFEENQDRAQVVLRNWSRECAQGLPLCEVVEMLEKEVGRVRSGVLA